jgi:Uma2 family endonuclease
MSAAIVIPPGEPSQRKRFTRAEVQQMADSGLFVGQRLELIEGDLIDKMGQRPPHAYVIRIVQALLAGLFGSERIQVQLPIEVQAADRKWSLPEPDVAILKEAKADFQTRYPRGTELVLVIEVADTTVRLDLTTKRDLYARAEVCEYWVLDLKRRCLTVHRQPSDGKYADIAVLPEGEGIFLESGNANISVTQILPDKDNLKT